jgi:hypothetical protein
MFIITWLFENLGYMPKVAAKTAKYPKPEGF